MEEPKDYRAVFASLMPNLFSQLQISPDETTLSESELRDVHRILALEKERQECNSGDCGNGSNNLNSSIKKSSVLMPRTISESNIELVKESLLRKESFTSSLFFNGKENVPSSEVLHRNRLSRRERSSRMTSRRKPFVVDLKNSDTNGLGECQKIKDVHAFWEAAEERDAAEAIINKLNKGTEISSESSSRKLGERRKNSQRKTSRLRGFSVELSSCVEQTIEEEEQRDTIEDSCFTSSANTQLSEDQIPISQIVDPIQSDVEFETMVCLDKAKSNLAYDVDIFCSTISSSSLHLDLPSVTISSPHMDLKDEIDNNRKATDCKDTCQASEIALRDQVEDLENSSAFASEGKIHRNVAEAANELDVIVVTPFVMRKKVQLKLTPYTSPTPPPNPLAGICFREEDNKRRLDFADLMHSSNLEEQQLLLDLDTSDLEKPQMPLDPGSSHVEPIDNVDAMDFSDLEPELPISTDIRKAENVLASSTTMENIIDERPSTEFSATTLPSKRTLQSPTSSFAGPIKKKQNQKTGAANRKKRIAEPRRNSLADAGTNWDVGVRRSTRIRSKPLEWWKGERFLHGRVHESLVTVIGIKYTSNSPCDPKKGPTNPKFKVESYVPEEFSKYVKFAAL